MAPKILPYFQLKEFRFLSSLARAWLAGGLSRAVSDVLDWNGGNLEYYDDIAKVFSCCGVQHLKEQLFKCGQRMHFIQGFPRMLLFKLKLRIYHQ
jgi:hypothetical protein